MEPVLNSQKDALFVGHFIHERLDSVCWDAEFLRGKIGKNLRITVGIGRFHGRFRVGFAR